MIFFMMENSLNFSELPFNQVPTLEVDGAVISFNKPIQAFLGKRLGKYQLHIYDDHVIIHILMKNK